MKIKILPENEAEKKRFKDKFNAEKIEHTGVKEYFMFGNKTSGENLMDFHEWTGSYRYLLSSIQYFYEIVNDQRKSENRTQDSVNADMFRNNKPSVFKDDDDDAIEEVASKQNSRMIKRGDVQQSNIIPIDIEAFKNAEKKPRKSNKPNQDVQEIQDAQFVEEKRDEGANNDDGFGDQEIPAPPQVPQVDEKGE